MSIIDRNFRKAPSTAFAARAAAFPTTTTGTKKTTL